MPFNDPDKLREIGRIIAEEMKHHLPPCHDLKKEEIQSLREIIKKSKRFDKGFWWLMITIGALVIAKVVNFMAEHISWGGK